MHKFPRSHPLCLTTLLVVVATAACGGGGDTTAPNVSAGATIELSLSGVRALDPATEGSYEAWVIDRSGTPVSAGKFTPGADGRATLTSPVAGGVALEITIEPPGDHDAAPSPQTLLRGDFHGTHADLSVEGAVTRLGALKDRPGQFTMFSPSDNAEDGYPSFEESGVWLFNMAPRDTPQGDMWVRLTPLTPGWVYEGWMVRDFGSASAIWLSYGKFLPGDDGAVNKRDDTGWGPYSGVTDFRTAGEEEFPGDDWISNPLKFPLPGGLTLPLNLREKSASGQGRWTHVITIEPAWNRGEAISTERPFIIRPYYDPFGDGGPGAARTITYHASDVPRGTAEVK